MRDVHEARLLIVDDEPELRRMLVSILRGDGYADVHEAARRRRQWRRRCGSGPTP